MRRFFADWLLSHDRPTGRRRRSRWTAQRRPNPAHRFDVILTLVVLFVISVMPHQPPSQAATGWQWYRTDTHVHSTISSDAFADLGIHAQAAKDAGYNALFLTDHNGGSSFHINNLTANHMAFEDSYTRWEPATYGALSSSTNSLVSSPVNSGSKSLRLAATASSGKSGEASLWTKRGPNFRSGDIILRVAIRPTRIDSGSGVYVSVSIGGDPRVGKTPVGYTTAGGVISPGKSTVLVWQLGAARTASSSPNERVLIHSLGSYTLNAWNIYTINVSQALASIPAADRPLDYDAVTYPKMAVAANGGTVEAFFDSLSIDASAPVAPANEYVHRTSVVGTYNTSTFKIFPAYEMGQTGHTQRFNFGITDPSEYVSYGDGTAGIEDTQRLGYPAQLNHPGTTITEQEAISTRGKGADFIEVRDEAWIGVWDEILKQGTQIIGGWSSDTHEGVSTSKAATYIYASALDFDKLLRSYYEGRAYMARASFDGRVVLNLDASSEPFPARYPIFVSPARSTTSLSLGISSDLSTSYQIRWIRNDALLATVKPSGSSHSETRSISLSGSTTYVRAEVRSSSSSLRAMTQPIFFVDVPDLPAAMSLHVDSVETATGRDYNRLLTKGITAASWDAPSESLSLALENPASARVMLLATTHKAPLRVRVDGELVPVASSATATGASTTSTWHYDAATRVLTIMAHHADTVADVKVAFSDATDTESPSAPGNLAAAGINGQRVDLSWSEASDDVGVTGYVVYRNDEPIATLGPQTSYSDTSVTAQTSYTYYVVARDATGNTSPPSNTATVTTGAPVLFSDGFETGDLSQWTNVTGGLLVQAADKYSGTYGLRANSSGSAMWTYQQLAATHNDLFYRVRFKLLRSPSSTTYLLKFRTSSGTSQLGLYVSSSGKLGYRNDVAAKSVTSSVAVGVGQWHEALVRIHIDPGNSAAGQTEVWLNGARVDELSRTEALGTTGVGRIQLGENSSGRTFDIVYDDVAVDPAAILP